MDKLKLLFCCYRGWALNICHEFKMYNHLYDVIELQTKDDITLDKFDDIKPDLIFFIGWSWIVPSEIIEKYQCLCLHPSPLPKYRGGSPIQNQILNGETESKVSIFRMTSRIDDGPLCAQGNYSLNGFALRNILGQISYVGSRLIKDLIEQYKSTNSILFWEQEGEPTVYKRRKPDQSEITPDDIKDSGYIYKKVLCLQSPYPNVYLRCGDGKKLCITEAHIE